ncbi:MAG: DUF2845 domain-containing protein [Methylophaga sp.]
MKWIILVTLVISFHAKADYELSEINSYRCGNALIQKGMTEREVISACGNKRPVDKRKWSRTYAYDLSTYQRHFEGWIFKDYGKFDVWIVFNGGQVVEVLQSNKRN